MCGRYTLATPPDELVEAFDVPELNFDWPARFNIAPGQSAPVVAADSRGRRMGLLTWGLVPGWMDEPGSGFINARAETVATKPSFREAYARRRCLVPADGFYEWQRTERLPAGVAEWAGAPGSGAKTPHWFSPAVGGVVSFAGLWESWRRPGHEPRHTFTILTTEANADIGEVHDRMPVVIGRADRALWLDRDAATAAVSALLRPPPDGTFEWWAVSTRVNKPTEDDPKLIDPVRDPGGAGPAAS